MKLFRNKWDKWHLFGGMFIGTVIMFSLAFPLIFMPIYYILAIIILFTSPFWWEWWDLHKVEDNEKNTLYWTNFEKMIFASDRKFDKFDMGLSFAGIVIGMILLTFLFKLFN